MPQSTAHYRRKSNDPNRTTQTFGLPVLPAATTIPSMAASTFPWRLLVEQPLELLRTHACSLHKTAEGFGVLPLGMNDYLASGLNLVTGFFAR